MSWHGCGVTLEAQMREKLLQLAGMTHMHPDVSAVFRVMSRPYVTGPEVLTALTSTVDALKAIEDYVRGVTA